MDIIPYGPLRTQYCRRAKSWKSWYSPPDLDSKDIRRDLFILTLREIERLMTGSIKTPQVFLQSYSVRNYRSVRDATILPNQQLSVLIGPNGAGKTNLLNAIRQLQPLVRPPYFRRDNPQSGSRVSQIVAEFAIRNRTVKYRAEVTAGSADQTSDDEFLLNEQWNIQGLGGKDAWLDIPRAIIERRGSKYAYAYRYVRDEHTAFYRSRRVMPQLPRSVIDTLSLISEFRSSISYYSASRFTDPSQCPTSFELDGHERPIETYKSRGPHFSFVSGLYFLSRRNRDLYDSYFEVVGPRGIRLIDDINWNRVKLPGGTVDIKAGGKIVRRPKMRTLIVPVISVKRSKLSFTQLSEGTLRALALLYYLITDRSGLLLLEEPEVCIHHGLLNSIVSALKAHSARKQIIITTHSEFILDSVMPENVFVVRNSARTGTTVRRITESLPGRQLAALRHYLVNTGTLGEYWTHGQIE